MTALCPRPIFVDDGFPYGQCRRRPDHGGDCILLEECGGPRPNVAMFGDQHGNSTPHDTGKEHVPYRFMLTRECLGVYRDLDMAVTRDGSGQLHYGGERTRCPLVVIGTNPSTATAENDDPTILKNCGFAQRLGYGRLVMVNAYGWRDTKPANMWAAHKAGKDIVGKNNDFHIVQAVREAWHNDGMVLLAWGTHPKEDRVKALRALLEATVESLPTYLREAPPRPGIDRKVMLHCLAVNNPPGSSPKHPLYIPYATQPQPWTWPS